MNQTGDLGHPYKRQPAGEPAQQPPDQTVDSVPVFGFYLAAGLFLLTFPVQWAGYRTDHQITNMVTAGLLLGAVLAFTAGWLRRFRGRGWLRVAPLWVLSLGVAGCAVIFKPVGVSGELIPQFVSRFEAPAELPSSAEGSDSRAIRVAVGPDDFPGFLGVRRDGRVPQRRFESGWMQHPPRLLWRQPIGAGWSGFAVAGAAEAAIDGGGPYAFTLEQRGDEEWVSCYDVSDGRLLWHHADRGEHFHPLGGLGPRSTPTVSAEGRIYAQGATGIVRCLDGRDGTLLWRIDLLEVAGIDQGLSETAVLWGRAGSPLLVDDLVVLPLGGDAGQPTGVHSLIALDAATGATRWTAGDQQISYASPVLATVGGVRQILSVNEDSVAGYSPEDGRVLWTHPWPGSSSAAANCSNPAPVGTDRVLLSKGYGAGAMLLRLQRESEQMVAEPVWANSRVLKTKFTNVCIDGEYAYALSDGALECVRLADGQSQWKQPRRGRFGHGHALIVGDVLVVLSETGELATVALDPEGYRELGRFQAIEGKTWNPPAVVGNLLVVRNGNEAAVWAARALAE